MIRAFIVDDEMAGIETLSSLLELYCTQVQIAGTATSINAAKESLSEVEIDVLFLDIMMPHGTGFDLLDSLSEINFKVIFCTAYDEHAIRAIRYKALDYLLKPIDGDELAAAIDKVKPQETLGTEYKSGLEQLIRTMTKKNKKITLASENEVLFVDIDDIIRIQAFGSYSEVYIINQPVVIVSRNLKSIEDQIEEGRFWRVHKSHLINPDHIVKLIKKDGGYLEMKDQYQVPISRLQRNKINEILGL